MNQTILTAVLTLLYFMITAQPDVWLGSVGWKIRIFSYLRWETLKLGRNTERSSSVKISYRQTSNLTVNRKFLKFLKETTEHMLLQAQS